MQWQRCHKLPNGTPCLSFCVSRFSPVNKIPTDYAIVLTRTARELGVDLLAELPVSQEQLNQQTSLPLDVYLELLDRYTRLQTDADWGFKLGQEHSLAHHGPLGFGALAAPTVGDGLMFLTRYIPVRASYTTASADQDRHGLHLRFRQDELVKTFLVRICETQSMVLQSFVESAGGPVESLAWQFPYAPPDHHRSYHHWLKGSIEFNAQALCLDIDPGVAALPSAFRNPASYTSAVAQCEAYLADDHPEKLSAKVETMLNDQLLQRLSEPVPVTRLPSAEAIARALNMSRRTLIRHLRLEQRPFQTIRSELLKHHAIRLLQQDMPIADIGERLGFADHSNFTRACKRFFGETPQAIRQRLR